MAGAGMELVWILPGYLLGALHAEVTLGRPLGPRRAALLAPRQLADHLPRRLLVAQRIGGALAALSVLVSVLWPVDSSLSPVPPAVVAGDARRLARRRPRVGRAPHRPTGPAGLVRCRHTHGATGQGAGFWEPEVQMRVRTSAGLTRSVTVDAIRSHLETACPSDRPQDPAVEAPDPVITR
jgi:hypothetical protein